ncbi:probable craniofacial development protein 2 at N-terminal half [Coccomyxa sp. Obi]|nr:probable craniofacial development protein 2 at N-terminal half [Coccomyxa sp. Obi]
MSSLPLSLATPKYCNLNPTARIATWNVKTLNDTRAAGARAEILVQRLSENSIDICCITEVRWLGSGSKSISGWTVAFSGRDDDLKRQGVGIVFSPVAARSFIAAEAISEGVMLAHFQLKSKKLSVICACAPTNDYPETEKDAFYSELQAALEKTSSRDTVMIAGDFNAQLGAEDPCSWHGSLGKFAYRKPNLKSNDMTHRLLNFCVSNELVVRNTFFNHKRIHLATWMGLTADDNAPNIRSQIDFILTKRVSAGQVLNCRVFRGAEFETDHWLLVSECRLTFKKSPREAKPVRYSAELMRSDDVQKEFRAAVNQQFDSSRHELSRSPEIAWQQFQSAMQVCGDDLLIAASQPHKPWLSARTLELIEKKQIAYRELLSTRKEGAIMALRKDHGNEKIPLSKKKYRTAVNLCRKSVRQDKREYWRKMSEELMGDFQKNNIHSAYQRLNLRMERETAKPLGSGSVRRPDGSIATDRDECARLRREYFQKLLNCQRDIHPSVWDRLPVHARPPDCEPHVAALHAACELPDVDPNMPPSLLEVERTIAKLKGHKAPGVCRIIPEMLKYGGEGTARWLHHVISVAWDSGEAPSDWKKALLVPVLKKGDTTKLDNYRGISLLSIAGKVYALLLQTRLEKWAETILSETQSGFRAGRGCTDAIFCLKLLYERALRKQKPVYTCFIDLSKAYDSADRQLAWQILRSRGAPTKVVDLIQDLHEGTTCAMQADHRHPDSWFDVATGFKQGDVNAPLLFNIYIDTVVRAFEPLVRHLGITWQYKLDGNLRECKNPTASNMSWIFMYADDIALVAETQEALQEALAIIDRVFIQWGMHINIRKTQILCLQSGTQTGDSSEQFWLRGQPLEQVQMFKYLGSICSADMSMQPEIASRLSRAGGAYHKLSRLKVWKDKNISLKIKVILYKVIVQSTLLYGCETWAVTNEDIRKLEVFQMRCLRRILGISLLERIPNAVTRAQCDIPEVANLIRYRRLRYLGHVARMGDTRLPLQFMFGTISGTGTRGRPMKGWNDYVRDDLEAIGLPYNWRRKCKNRDEWRAAIKVLLDVPSP